jgi:hypothetical protein
MPYLGDLPRDDLVLLCRWSRRRFSPLWIHADDLAEEGLLLSRHMLLDHFPDRALSIIQSALTDVDDNGHSPHNASHTERTYTAPHTQSVTYSQQNYHTGHAACPPDLSSAHVGSGSTPLPPLPPPRAQTLPASIDTEISVSMPAAGLLAPASARSRKAQSVAVQQQVAAGGLEVDVVMSSTSALSRVSSGGMIGL